jgi:hypothetical protein
MELTKRSFNALINSVTTRKQLDIKKIVALPDESKDALVYFIVRNRGPLIYELITDNIDKSWLFACGYSYKTKGKKSGYTFIHTSEHRII